MPIAQPEFLVEQNWVGSAEKLAKELDRVMTALGLTWDRPPVRTVRLWRTRGLLSNSASRNFGRRQFLEALAVVALQRRGWSLAAIKDLLPRLDNETIMARVAEGDVAQWGAAAAPEGVASSNAREYSRRLQNAECAVIVLSQGILTIYDQILGGGRIVRQDDAVPSALHKAMCLLGRLYLEEAQCDRAACVHDILDRCRFPFGSPEWGLSVMADPAFRFRDAVLVDPELRVPTDDAEAIAAVGGRGLEDVIEHQLHSRLRELTERLGPMRNAAYTAVRELVARKSLAAEAEIGQWFEERRLSAIQHIVEDLYDAVPDAWLIDGRANRCCWCGTLLRPHRDRTRFPDGKCPLRQCDAKHDARASDRLVPPRILVCRPQVLAFWAGPAIDEIILYDAARRANLEVELYPESDRCDLSVGGSRIGIDVKSYSSPVSLGLKLNVDIGGLAAYQRRIVAVGDELARRPGYMDVLRQTLNRAGEAGTIEIMSVAQVISQFETGVLNA